MRLESDNGQELIKELEAKRGGEIKERTFSLFYADNNGKIVETGVLIYRINDTIWIEDFEKTPSIFGIKVREPKNYRYEKFERSFLKSDIAEVISVLKKDAQLFAEKRISEIHKAGKLGSFFSEPVSMIKFKDGNCIFLQMLNNKIIR